MFVLLQTVTTNRKYFMLTSVIIADLNERHLPETVENLYDTASDAVEVIVKKDDDSRGMRRCLNKAAKEAKGEYLFKVDGHCIMQNGWDVKLHNTFTSDRDMAVCSIREIDEPSWTIRDDKGFDQVTINSDLTIIGQGLSDPDSPLIQETMASIGCGFMLARNRFYDLGGMWEELWRWGNLGAEWALKVWLSGGRVFVNRDVICGHLFRRQGLAGGGPERNRLSRHILGRRFASMQGPEQIYPLGWLAKRFNKKQEVA